MRVNIYFRQNINKSNSKDLEESRNKMQDLFQDRFSCIQSKWKTFIKCKNEGHIACYCNKSLNIRPTQIRNDKFKTMPNVKRCYNCNSLGHFAKSCRKTGDKDKQICNICKKSNHSDKSCYFLKNSSVKKNMTSYC